MPSSTTCEDCGAELRGNSDNDDVMMDVVVGDVDGGYGGFGSSDGDDHTCGACGKAVCFSCSVSNLGEHRRCLVCAGRGELGAGWGTRLGRAR